MQVLKTLEELQKVRAHFNLKLAFVPTMGALHEGHLALVQEARKHADKVIVSIFVNPTQFGKNEDFDKYPRVIEDDIKLLTGLADYVYLPRTEDIYPNGEEITVKAKQAAEGLCGHFRPGHFDGVATVVTTLFKQVKPTIALFGEKDYQQLMVIKDMRTPGIEIVGVPTLREPDGLALSSRNRYLTQEQRKIARLLYQTISSNAPRPEMLEALKKAGFRVQYLEKRWDRLLIAAYLGNTRLIDNIPLK